MRDLHIMNSAGSSGISSSVLLRIKIKIFTRPYGGSSLVYGTKDQE